LSKSRICLVFSTLIGLLRYLDITLLCGSDHFMVNVSSSSVYYHWTSIQWHWCRSWIADEAVKMDQYTLWLILWIWCKQFHTIISRIPHFPNYVWCHGQIHKLTAYNTDCIELSTLAYNIATFALFLKGSTVFTFAVLVDLKLRCPLVFRHLGHCGTRCMLCAVPSYELSDLLCCWSRHIIQQVGRCFIWVLETSKLVVNILGSPYQSHLPPLRTTRIKTLCRSLLRPYTVKVEIE